MLSVLERWPEDLPGRETLYQAIELTLAEIRRADRLADLPPVAATAAPSEPFEQQRYDDLAARQFRGISWTLRLNLLLIIAMVSVALYLWSTCGGIAPYLVMATAILAASAFVAAGFAVPPARS